jgi:hypothetical protein
MARPIVQQPNALPQIKEGLSKKQITALVEQSVENVLEEGNVEQVAEALAVMDEFVKGIRKDDRFIDIMREELVKHHGSIKTTSGARIELCEAGVTYDYSEDPSWRYIDEQIKLLTEQRRQIEEKLRSIPPGKMMVDHETGEVLTGALRSSRSTYKITLSK